MLAALKLIGTSFQIAGVFLLASRVVSPPAAYVGMTVGSVAWGLAAYRMREPGLLALNVAFTAANLLGLWRWA